MRAPIEEEEEEEEEDDLEPYDLTDDGADLAPVPPPRYLRELLDLLNTKLEAEDARDRHVAAIASAEALIRAQPADLADVAGELARSLLHVDNYFALDEFADQAQLGLNALAALRPVEVVADYLAPHFFTGDLTVSKRLCILDVLKSASRELAGRIDQPQPTPQPLVDAAKPRVQGRRALVAEIAPAKTRRWGYRRNPVGSTRINRFAAVAPRCFFFPLLVGYATHAHLVEKNSTFKTLVRARVVDTLCCFVDCVRATPVALSLATHLLAFAWQDAHSNEPALRRAALYAVLTAVSTAHDAHDQLDLLSGNEVAGTPTYHDVMQLADAASYGDPDPGVREVASAIAGYLPRLLMM